jgi:2-(1,2-epoxy-1,2-dihydrophenyl)acetyl-CoA isomerase
VSVVLREITAAGVGAITLNRPERMNAITTELGRELEHALRILGSDPAVNVIVVRGAGENFCAGGDVAEVQRLRASGPQSLRTLFDAFGAACELIATLDVPVIAAVNGVAMAGGFELMQAADIVLVSDDARIADSHINFGMIPGGGSTARLPRLVGPQTALGLLLSGNHLTGVDAVRLGLAYRSFAAAEFDSAVEEFATGLAGRSRRAVTTIKRLVRTAQMKPLGEALQAEIDSVVDHISGQGVADFDRIGATQ